MDLAKLKSGTDIRGTALTELGANEVRAIARGFARFIGKKRIAVGHDSRLSADILSGAAIEGLMDEGCNVLFCGLCSTPSMFMTTVLEDCDGAIMLTASHHPKDKNGMKFFDKGGGVDKNELNRIIELAQKDGKSANSATFEEKDFLEKYCAHMRSIFINELGEQPLKGLKIAVDAGNGASGFFATRILLPLGADISGSQYLEPNGNFPFHAPNPEDKAAMESISKRVVETKSNLGVIFDTDGDRSAIVLGNGKEINRNRLIAMTAACLLKNAKGAYVVTDSVTSDGLHEFVERLGGVHIRYKRGYQNVIKYARQLVSDGKNAVLAMETSGHAALKENFFLDDGAYLAAKLIIEEVRQRRAGKSLTDLIDGLKEPLEELAIRIKITAEDFGAKANEVMSALEKLSKDYRVATDSFEGIKTYIDNNCYFLARLSVHDPVIPINIESNYNGGVQKTLSIIKEGLKSIKEIEF